MARGKRSQFARDVQLRIGQRLAALRTDRGWTLAELEARSGLSPRVAARIERGEREPDVSILIVLADVFDIAVGDLFADLPTPPISRGADWPNRESIAETQAMLEAFIRIADEDHRRKIVALLKACVASGQY
jgi:transcriptional regulator with XRE-family HTH domain